MWWLFLLASIAIGASAPTEHTSHPFTLARAGEAVATITARCAPCDWGRAGVEAAAIRVSVDGRYSQHVMLVRGETAAPYRVTLGMLSAGAHRLDIDRDAGLSAPSAGAVTVESASVEATSGDDGDRDLAQSMAPILHARPNTIGRFTDVPLLMWYEVVSTPRGRQFRYSVVFSNEDGGTATDRLMATWGRTTDIEFVYGVEVDRSGAAVAEEFQGPGHEVPSFNGRHDGRHPLLFVSTDNNMVSTSGPSTVRYAPAPVFADLTNRSREVVMDRAPWTNRITALEMTREGKISPDRDPKPGSIPDLRRYVFVEACTELTSAALSFAVEAGDAGVTRWFESDRGDPAFRIVRDGCFRGAVPLPSSAGPPTALRFRAFARPARGTATAVPAVRLTRVNTVFTLDERFQPTRPLFSWTGAVSLPVDGDAYTLSLSR